ncbi:hypothetical protein [Actinophytocola sp.]|uniref:hypothetical protein n=1 Tax=Actinophytocola sp. TaxID=1872138 RepID=UPI002ED6802E
MFTRRNVVITFFVLLLGGMFAAPAASAAPVDVAPLSCSHAWTDADPSSGLLVRGTDARLRQAPHFNSCEIFGLIQPSHRVDFHCWAFGDTSSGISTWTHLRVLSGPNVGKQGWVHDSLLVGNGSNSSCSGRAADKP